MARLRSGPTIAVVIATSVCCQGCARIGTDSAMPVDGAGQPSGVGTGGRGGATGAGAGSGGAVRDAAASDIRPGDGMSSFDGLVNADVNLNGGADAACATQSAKAETLPLDLYVMVDSSGSMLETTSAGQTKWAAVKDALAAFFNDTDSAGLGVGLQYFPLTQPGVPAACMADSACGNYGPCLRLRTCFRGANTSLVACAQNSDCAAGETCYLLGICGQADVYCGVGGSSCARGDTCAAIDGYCQMRDRCDVQSYAAPAVAIAVLPGAAAGLVRSLDLHQPDGLTPTAPALSGGLQRAAAYATANPGHKTALVFVTDGLPSECAPVEIPGIAQLARAGVQATPSVPTFVIGVFSPADSSVAATNLNTLADAGGTGTAVIINTNQNVTQTLQSALARIRTTAVACEYKIPPATGGAIDFSKVNVQITDGSGGQTTIGHVSGRAGCSATRGGWYYDVEPGPGQTPSSITMCDATCSQLRATASGRVDIVLGCQTVIII